jgi:hypothetical protein
VRHHQRARVGKMLADRPVQFGELALVAQAELEDHRAQAAHYDITGPSVQITDRVAALARPAEILVSRTVKDLVTGSGITFAERGSYALNGPPDEWPLFAVTGLGLPTGPAFQIGPDLGDAAVQVVE